MNGGVIHHSNQHDQRNDSMRSELPVIDADLIPLNLIIHSIVNQAYNDLLNLSETQVAWYESLVLARTHPWLAFVQVTPFERSSTQTGNRRLCTTDTQATLETTGPSQMVITSISNRDMHGQ